MHTRTHKLTAQQQDIQKQQWLGAGMVMLSAMCFSAKAVFAKLAYRYGADASTVLTLRLAFALPFFLLTAIYAERRTHKRLTRREWQQLALLGIFGYYLASLFDFLGLQYISASLERLILFLYPTLVILMNALFHREAVGKHLLSALALSYGGIALVFIHDLHSGGDQVWLGSTLVFLGAITYAFYLSGSQPLIQRHGSLRITSHVLVIACLSMLLQFTLEQDFARLHQPWQVIALCAATGIVATVLPAFLLTAGIRRLGSSRAALIGTVGPVSTLVLANLVLNETITLLQLLGSVLVLLGVWRVSQQTRKPATPAEEPL